jgi:two-component system, sensor histidine kinase and response regulator
MKVLLALDDVHKTAVWRQRLDGWGVDVGSIDDEAGFRASLDGLAGQDSRPDAVIVDQDWIAGMAHRIDPGHAPRVLCMVTAIHRAATASLPDEVVRLHKPVLPATLRRALLMMREGGELSLAEQLRSGHVDAGFGIASLGRPLDGLRVLLVEDNETNQLVARIFLERLGVTVTVAGNGAEALAVLQHGSSLFDAVLMDMHMPVMDGLESTRRIRALPALSELPVIGMTAAAMAEDRTLCIAAGMSDYLTKPIVVDQVVSVLKRWTGTRDESEVSNLATPKAAGDGLEIDGFNLAALPAFLRGNPRLLRRLLEKFAVQESATADEVVLLIADGRYREACERLHSLRGGASSLGAVAITSAALDLEQSLSNDGAVNCETLAFVSAMRSSLAAVAACFKSTPR